MCAKWSNCTFGGVLAHLCANFGHLRFLRVAMCASVFSSLQLVSDCFANVQSSCCNSVERLDSTSKSATNSVLFVSEEQSSNLLCSPTCSANASGILCNSIDPFLGSIIFESARLGCACNSVWNSLVCSRVDVRLRACAQGALCVPL